MELIFDRNNRFFNRLADAWKGNRKGNGRRDNLSARKKFYYEFTIGALEIFIGHSNIAVTLLPVTAIYFIISGLISLAINYDLFMMPPLLRIFVLGVCTILLFVTSGMIRKKAQKVQKRFEEKINFKRTYHEGNPIFVLGGISAIVIIAPLSILCLFGMGILIFKIFTNF